MDNDLDLVYKQLFLENGTSRHIFSFISGTEQTGTSWCALSIAHALNVEKNKVLLVDANGNFSNIASYLKLDSPLYLEAYTQGKKTLNQLITAYKNRDFNILTASAGTNYLLNQQQGRIQIFAKDLNIIAQNYDYTIIDLGTEIHEKNLSLCLISFQSLQW